MSYQKILYLISIGALLFLFSECRTRHKPTVKSKDLVKDSSSINEVVESNLEDMLEVAKLHNGKVSDSLILPFHQAVYAFYASKEFKPVWSDKIKWDPLSDSLMQYLDTAILDGLYPQDYHYAELTALKKRLKEDSLSRLDAILWTKADLLHTDAVMHLLQDLKQGRLQHDSLFWTHQQNKLETFFLPAIDTLFLRHDFGAMIRSAQPSHQGYLSLKNNIRALVDSMDLRLYTYINFPDKENMSRDSANFIKSLIKRLGEGDHAVNPIQPVDSTSLADAIKKYQKKRKWAVDGKASLDLVNRLNATDQERFRRIAITLDRYKQLPSTMPEKYIWVNIPAYNLELWDTDTIRFESKVVVGKPNTPTPELTSAINDMVIFPTWTVPESIIAKEMLPGLKKNKKYLETKGLYLLNRKGQKIRADTINWARYSKGIPFKIQQGSGDDNALGVIKFNFSNPYAVYLHDTNQRYLFSKTKRALSHGCVRVQEWQKLAAYLAKNDSIYNTTGDTLRYNVDSIANWIAQKERHRINVNYKFPLFIRYFGCASIGGKLRFYEDIYDLDKLMRNKYFAGKEIISYLKSPGRE